MRDIVVGTRGSALALKQANMVKKAISLVVPKIKVHIKEIKTSGDNLQGSSDKFKVTSDTKGLFTREIEDALLKGDIHMAVHSMKDLPVELPDRLVISAMLEREDFRDVFISKDNIKIKDMSSGFCVGTSSLRRKSQLLNFKKNIKVIDLIGNVNTRISKLQCGENQLDAIILAYAGIKRLGYREFSSCQCIPKEIMLPAVGQGAIGIETRNEDSFVREITDKINHLNTFIEVNAERSFLKGIGGGCQNPIGCLAVVSAGQIRVEGVVLSEDGTKKIKASVIKNKENYIEAGKELAEKLLSMGAKDILNC